MTGSISTRPSGPLKPCEFILSFIEIRVTVLGSWSDFTLISKRKGSPFLATVSGGAQIK